jgi:hypothetical protein
VSPFGLNRDLDESCRVRVVEVVTRMDWIVNVGNLRRAHTGRLLSCLVCAKLAKEKEKRIHRRN